MFLRMSQCTWDTCGSTDVVGAAFVYRHIQSFDWSAIFDMKIEESLTNKIRKNTCWVFDELVIDRFIDPRVAIDGLQRELLDRLLVELLHGEDVHPARRPVLYVLHLNHHRRRLVVRPRVLFDIMMVAYKRELYDIKLLRCRISLYLSMYL